MIAFLVLATVALAGSPQTPDAEMAALRAQDRQLRALQEETLRKKLLPEVFTKSAAHYRALDAAATPLMEAGDAKGKVPHSWSAKGNRLDMRSIYWWTSGHFPGSLWYLYEATGDEFFKERATVWTEMLAPNSKVTDNHDVGFIMNCSYGNARRILKTDKYDDLLRETAASLSKRFNPSLGLIRSWGALDGKNDFLVIPDNLMNLELLEAVAKNGEWGMGNGEPGMGNGERFDKIARSHADVTMKHHFRADGGCFFGFRFSLFFGFRFFFGFSLFGYDLVRRFTVDGFFVFLFERTAEYRHLYVAFGRGVHRTARRQHVRSLDYRRHAFRVEYGYERFARRKLL